MLNKKTDLIHSDRFFLFHTLRIVLDKLAKLFDSLKSDLHHYRKVIRGVFFAVVVC